MATILVVEDDPAAVRLLRAYLEKAAYQARVAVDGPSGFELARQSSPAAIVLDVMLPGMDGWEVLRRLKLDPSTRNIPVIMVTVVDEKEVGFALGAVDYLVKPIDPEVLLAVLAQQALIATSPGGSSDEPVAALYIDDDPASLEMVATCLGQQGIAVSTADNGADGLELARTRHLDLILCDLLMPGIDGFKVVAELHASPTTRDIPILVVTAQDLTDADKDRLNGNILGIIEKGAALDTSLQQWLARVQNARPVVSSAQAGNAS